MKGCRRWLRRASRAVALGVVLGLAGAAAASSDAAWYLSERGAFQVAFTSDLDPIVINRMHGWVLHVRDDDGEPVDDAELDVDGGMPAHDHGLPTRPQVTAVLGGGRYRLEGLRFHMHGEWEVVVTVRAGGRSDRVVIPLTL